MTQTMSSMVTAVSAMLVARMILRTPTGGRMKTLRWSCVGTIECRGSSRYRCDRKQLSCSSCSFSRMISSHPASLCKIQYLIPPTAAICDPPGPQESSPVLPRVHSQYLPEIWTPSPPPPPCTASTNRLCCQIGNDDSDPDRCKQASGSLQGSSTEPTCCICCVIRSVDKGALLMSS